MEARSRTREYFVDGAYMAFWGVLFLLPIMPDWKYTPVKDAILLSFFYASLSVFPLAELIGMSPLLRRALPDKWMAHGKAVLGARCSFILFWLFHFFIVGVIFINWMVP